ncbi:MAG: hypothetical protein DCC52_16995, partial [Chloroflexi bacterium]
VGELFAFVRRVPDFIYVRLVSSAAPRRVSPSLFWRAVRVGFNHARAQSRTGFHHRALCAVILSSGIAFYGSGARVLDCRVHFAHGGRAVFLFGLARLGDGNHADCNQRRSRRARYRKSRTRKRARGKSNRAASQTLLDELQSTHQQLKLHSAQGEELAALEERNRLARELHDSVSQTLFSIILNTRAAQLQWARDPLRARDTLARLQELTQSALAQIRTLITERRLDA